MCRNNFCFTWTWLSDFFHSAYKIHHCCTRNITGVLRFSSLQKIGGYGYESYCFKAKNARSGFKNRFRHKKRGLYIKSPSDKIFKNSGMYFKSFRYFCMLIYKIVIILLVKAEFTCCNLFTVFKEFAVCNAAYCITVF